MTNSTDYSSNSRASISHHTEAARKTLRKSLRTARKSLADSAQIEAANAITTQLNHFFATFFSHHSNECSQQTTINTASYLVNDGEVNLSPFMQQARNTLPNVRFSLPVLHPVCKGHLLFLKFDEHTALVKNKYNIEEPVLACPSVIPSSQLDVILMPLVGFDTKGNRLGMGGGYYDRTLAFTKRTTNKPLLIGVAHDVQEVERLPIAPWDIPLNAIITPTRLLQF